MPIITRTLNINNLRATSAKYINLRTIRKLAEYFLKNVWQKQCSLLPFSRYCCPKVSQYCHLPNRAQGAKGSIFYEVKLVTWKKNFYKNFKTWSVTPFCVTRFHNSRILNLKYNKSAILLGKLCHFSDSILIVLDFAEWKCEFCGRMFRKKIQLWAKCVILGTIWDVHRRQ